MAQTLPRKHIFTLDCPYLSQDAVFCVKESLTAQFDF